ncbi:PH domain-containing protein [Cellulomonas gelida]|uniref:YdbS-like PH domain-containing protein n=1 Tax=Cellulomonas gelida TaxID=1712 RepID=A0A4Y3KHJ4_9CELL|nr:PH domain-containing protein [Cellulomonas gelida]GEA83482.1 hypothetical protein CGE01nite_07330 [Cellulomonas gelida]GGL24623.1 hypothetical protein GCM10009774_13860 [Cellulomonas gelida]
MTTDDATRIVMTHRLLRRYVLPGERVVLAARWHWAKLVEPAVTASVVFCVCGWLTYVLQSSLGDRALVVWWLWVAALLRFGWLLLVWRVEWFVATDKRMLLLTGLVTHQIGMMPLMKVTDMRYSRSVLGQVLGYGQFLLESAGQDQALRQINWVARPDATYRDLCALIFTPADMPPSDGEDDAGPPTRPRPRPDGSRPDGPPGSVPPGSAPPGSVPPGSVPPAVVPARPSGGGRLAVTADRWAEPLVVWPTRDHPFDPDDTQPLRVSRRATTDAARVAPVGPVAPVPPGTDEDESHEPSWYVSEPTARFVDLHGARHDPDTADDTDDRQEPREPRADQPG